MTLTNAGRHYVHSCYTELHPNHAVNVKRMGRDSFTKYDFHFADFRETHNHGKHFVDIYFARFYLNQIKM
jgi:hypothetical protein